MQEPHYDVAIVGAGPNGLTAAAYLARAGARVVLLERRFERGGTLATDDYSTPFLYNLAQFALPLGIGLLPYHDLQLQEHGVSFVEPALVFSTPADSNGEVLIVGRGGEGLGQQVAAMLASVSDAVAPILYRPPEAEGALLERFAEEGWGPAVTLAELSPAGLAEQAPDRRGAAVLRYACGLTGFTDDETPLGLIGAYAVARLFSPSLVVGGTKCLANALFRVASAAGASCSVTAGVVAIEREGESFALRLLDGQLIRARTAVSTLDPATTFLHLLRDELVPEEIREAARTWIVDDTGSFTAHYGIKGELPSPPGGENGEPLMRLIGVGDGEAVAARFRAVRAGELPADPAGHLTAVTAHDRQQASPGPFGPLNTFRFEGIAPFAHPEATWERRRRSYRKTCWDTITASVEELRRATLLFAFCDSPQDLERRFRTARRGSIRQGALIREQTLINRPHPSCCTARTPIPGFYLGGGGVHPGIPGSLAGGYNAASVVCDDLGLDRWWPRSEELSAPTASSASRSLGKAGS